MSWFDRAEKARRALLDKEKVNILAIESSCDETAAAVVCNGRDIIGDALYTQIAIHAEYGGVVPELASRSHVEKLPYVADAALEAAGMELSQVDAVAVTAGPGLVGALLTGVSYAKALAFAADKPLIAVNHMRGHICANFLAHRELEPPFVCLLVSGGHTQILHVHDYDDMELMGTTRDDAAGEAIDKIARVLGLPYPGGPALQALAKGGDALKYKFPKSFRGETHLDFSFSGLKTAAINMLHQMEQKNETFAREDVAASFQSAVVENLIKNGFEALRRTGEKRIVLAGGVCANELLRSRAQQEAKACGAQLYLPELKYCTDNAAMIGSAAFYTLKKPCAGLDLNADPALE